MGNKTKINQEILKEYIAGEGSVESICIKHNISPGSLYYQVNKKEISKRGHKKNIFNLEQIKILYIVENKSPREISELFSCSYQALRDFIKNNKLSILKKESRKLEKIKQAKFKKSQPKNKIRRFSISKESLYQLYFIEKKSTREVGKIFGTTKTTIVRYMKQYGLKQRTQKEYFEQIGVSLERRENMSKQRMGKFIGPNSPAWKGGKTNITLLIRGMPEYKLWRQSCFKRDNFICTFCRKPKQYLNADHIKPISAIIRENNIDGTIEARNCNELWDLSNARTLCEACHKKTETFKGKARKYKTIIENCSSGISR